MVEVLLDFVMNNKIAMIAIGAIAYAIVGIVMRSLSDEFGLWLGRRGGFLAWLIVAIAISALYHKILDICDWLLGG